MSSRVAYDAKPVNLPRLSGATLKLVVGLLESPLARWLLVSSMLESGGSSRLRSLLLDEAPTFQPHFPVTNAVDPAHWSNADALALLSRSPPPQPRGFAFATCRDYTEAYRSGRATPEEVAERLLDAVDDSDRRDPPMRIFIAWKREELMSQARASAQRWRDGAPLGPLDGVPVAVKDEVDMVPFPTTAGTRFLGRQPAREDSTVVARMRAAGALLIGKANMHEIGIGVTGQNPHHGTVRNPYDPGRHTGGSSSGPAAAVAAGLCPIAIGADGGGSIRIPCSLCGLVGLKSTFGRVSGFGAAPLGWTMAHYGPIAATAHDAALGYAILAGPDIRYPASLQQPGISLDGFGDRDLGRITLGVYRPWFRHAAPGVVAACERMLEQLMSLGARIAEIEIPELDIARVAHTVIIASEMNAGLERHYASHRRDYSLEVRLNLALVRTFTARDYLQAQRMRTRAIAHLERALRDVDAIVTPTTGIAAPTIRPAAAREGESDIAQLYELMRFALIANLTGHPAISFPAGYDPDGLPVGFQAIGRPWQEHLLLRLAAAAEHLVERKPPAVHYRILPERST